MTNNTPDALADMMRQSADTRLRQSKMALTPTAQRFTTAPANPSAPVWPPALAGDNTPRRRWDDPTTSTDPAGEEPVAIDWDVVARLRSEASNTLAGRMKDEPHLSDQERRELGRSIISEQLDNEAAERAQAGQPVWDHIEQAAYAEAIFSAMFGAGRLQPLLDRDDVENILVAGCRNVWLELADGSRVSTDPVADSDDELNGFLDFLAQRTGTGGRSFSPSSPSLHLRMEDGSRMAATAWVHPYTSVVIRRHRLKRITLDDLVATNTITPLIADFLRAAVAAELSTIVAGEQKAGKTTLLRALINEIGSDEVIGTFETEYELHTHEEHDKHPIVYPWEEHPGNGEVGPDGTRSGAFTLSQALVDSFRFALDRYIVGEIRGPEVWVLVKALESGGGAFGTTHAKSADLVLDKLVSCCVELPNVDHALAADKLAQAIDLVVYIKMESHKEQFVDDHGITQTRYVRRRYVDAIKAIEPSKDATESMTDIFIHNPAGGPAIPDKLPDRIRNRLVRAGFNDAAFTAAAGGVI